MRPFRKVPLGRVAKVQSGYAFKSSQWMTHGIPVVRIGNVKAGWLDLSDAIHLPEHALIDQPDYALKKNDIVITMTGEVGERALVRTEQPLMLNQRVGRVVWIDHDQLDRLYLYFALGHPETRGQLKRLAHGVAQPNISPSAIQECGVYLPSLAEQRRIASILSAYDDLIEVNRRRVAILEEMARRLFEEWFVHLRFPGHESVPVHDTAAGPVPKGWIMGVVSDLLTLHRGYDLATNDRSPGEVPVMTGSGRNGTHDTHKINAPGVVTGRSGTIGAVFLVHENFWPLNTALYVSSFTCIGPTYALFLLRQLNLRTRAGGAAVPTLNRNHVHALPVLRPPAAIVERYEHLAAPALQQAWVLEQQSERLAAARDLLLPRLISGELSVADAPAPHRLLAAAD